MATRDTLYKEMNAVDLAASSQADMQFYFPHPARIVRYYVVPSEDQAAHATATIGAVFTNKGTDGTGTTTLATITNDSDDSNSTTLISAAYSANVAAELKTEDRPGSPSNDDNEHDEVAAGSVVECVLAAGSGTTTMDLTVGIEYMRGD